MDFVQSRLEQLRALWKACHWILTYRRPHLFAPELVDYGLVDNHSATTRQHHELALIRIKTEAEHIKAKNGLDT